MKFKAWTHPKTGEQRIYANGIPNRGGAKVFLTSCTADSFGYTYDIVVTNVSEARVSPSTLKNDVEAKLTELNHGSRPKTWDGVIMAAGVEF